MKKTLQINRKANVPGRLWRLMLVLLMIFAFDPIHHAQAAEAASTTVSITAITPNPAYIEQTVTVQIQVAAVDPLKGIPDGSVEIRSGQDRVCTIALDPAGGGSCTLKFNSPATVSLKAVYLGTNSFLPSVSAEINLVVKNKYTPQFDILSDLPDPSVINRLVDVIVRLSSTGPVPTGNVTVWRSDSTCKKPPVSAAVDQCTATLNAGAGSCQVPLTASGEVYLCAAYEGDVATFEAQAAPVTHQVSTSNTFTTITQIDPEPSILGATAWVYYSVTSPDGAPLQTDRVKVTSGSSTCTGTIADGRCALTFTKPHLNDVIAEYQGTVASPVLEPSFSPVVVHRVNAPPTGIRLSSSEVSVFSAVGKEVAVISAVDPNPDETHLFSLAVGTGDGDNGLFRISGDRLLVNGSIPQNRTSGSIRIRATDPSGLLYEQSFTIRFTSNAVLPDTGFARSQHTEIMPQPLEKRYQALGSLELEIPRLGIQAEITGVPYLDEGWDTTWLWNQVGWLNGTAFPGWNGNSVLAAHNYLSNGLPGPFVLLQDLRWGDQILVHAYGETQVYEVRSIETVRSDQSTVLRHENNSWLTLVTCKSYDEEAGVYRNRVVVRAVEVEVR